MANYFSDDERKRLQWVRRSFFTALSIGVLALLYALFPSKFTSLMFTLVVTVYYAIFGIRFINYAFTFQEIEAPLLTPQEEESGTDGSQALEEQEALMARIDALMTDRRLYTKPDLTIEDVAVQAGTSYRFISSAINACRHTNFKGWVNGYRVAEAQRLIHEGYLGSHTIEALAAAVGFSSRTNLYRVFKKLTSQSPTDFCPPATKF
jgi:AraC-like DNA-binding protein